MNFLKRQFHRGLVRGGCLFFSQVFGQKNTQPQQSIPLLIPRGWARLEHFLICLHSSEIIWVTLCMIFCSTSVGIKGLLLLSCFYIAVIHSFDMSIRNLYVRSTIKTVCYTILFDVPAENNFFVVGFDRISITTCLEEPAPRLLLVI